MRPVYLVSVLLVVFVVVALVGCRRSEAYRDPIYLNPEKMYQDWYPRANGTIYGPFANIFSGHPYYPRAY